MKKVLALLLTASMLLFTACGSNGGETPAAQGSDTALSDEQIDLVFWHIWPDTEMGQIVEDYIALFEEEHPNINIEAVATQEVEYQNNKLKIAAATGAQGDVFMCWGGGYAKSYVDAGTVLPLDSYFDKYNTKEEMLDGVLTYSTYDGKAYGIPLKQWAGALFCNEELFEQYGVKIPETWDELMTAVKTFRENDVTPMALGAKDGWHIGMIQNALAVRTAGADYMNQALSGQASFDTPEIAESAKLLCELNEAGAFVKGTMGISAEEAQEEFYMGMVPMYFGGSWVASGCDSEENSIQGKIKAVPMPVVDQGKGDETAFSGGVIDFMMINAKTEHPEEAYLFAEGIAKYMSVECYKMGDSLPAWKIDVDEAEISPTLSQIKALTQTSTGYVLAWDTFLQGAAIDTHYQLLQGLIAGTTTPEEFAKGMQEAVE